MHLLNLLYKYFKVLTITVVAVKCYFLKTNKKTTTKQNKTKRKQEAPEVLKIFPHHQQKL